MARSQSRSRSPRRDRIRDRGREREREKDRTSRRERDRDHEKDRRPRRDVSPARDRKRRSRSRSRPRAPSDSPPPRRRSVSVDLKKTRDEKEQDRLEREAEERERQERERRVRGEEAGANGKAEKPQQDEEYDFQDVFEGARGDKVASFIEEVREQSAQEAEVERKLQEEAAAMALMGFPGGFDTSKGKYVPGTNHSGVKVTTKRQARQYMNRKGGFNRPLPAEKNK